MTRSAWRVITLSGLRAVGSVVAFVTAYYLLPLDTSVAWAAITILVAGLVVLVVLIALSVRSILRSPFPALRAIEALAITVPLFLLLFASAYVVMDQMARASFGQPLTHTDALYFTVTVFTTVGFGDITARTEPARVLVTIQMIMDLVIIGIAIQAIIGAARHSRQQRSGRQLMCRCGRRLRSAWQHEAMTVSRQPDTTDVLVREYAESDYGACRSLWAELTEYHRRIYRDPSIGGKDPGAGLDGYLATSELMGSWVAESQGSVVGLTGLFDRGTSGEVEPVVVAESVRGRGIGSMLISRVVDEARARGYEYLAIRPVARNVTAVRRFHAAGFRTLGGHVDMTMDLAARRHGWLSGASLHGLDFDY
jgi:GNAT superfamily N-acetyltransferase